MAAAFVAGALEDAGAAAVDPSCMCRSLGPSVVGSLAVVSVVDRSGRDAAIASGLAG